jgi:hypothetical protein
VILLSSVGFLSLAVLGPAMLWPRKPYQAPAILASGEKLERARKLRQRSWILLGLAVTGIYGGYATFGFLMAVHANTDSAKRQQVEGTGVASSCSRDWTYLGQLWSCDVTIDQSNPKVTILSPTGASPFTTTVRYSQFTPDDIGRPVPMTASPNINPFAGAFEWSVAEKPGEPPIARWLFIMLPIAGLVCLVVALGGRKQARRYEREALAPPVVQE